MYATCTKFPLILLRKMPKSKTCKSAGLRLRRFESYLPHQIEIKIEKSKSAGPVPAFFMSRMLRNILVMFQQLPIARGSSVQHNPDMDEPADDLEAAAAAAEFLGLGGEDVQLWMRMTKRLALDNAQTQLHDRQLKTEVLHTTIVKVATWYLTDTRVPENKRTMTNAVAVVMEAFGAKHSALSLWVGG
jgi:hypothetical protein